MRDSLLEPLGMNHSTFDRAGINANADRAIGHVHPYPKPLVDVPMTGAGGLYTSAADLARFLHFELNGGSIDGRIVRLRARLHAGRYRAVGALGNRLRQGRALPADRLGQGVPTLLPGT